MPAQKRRTKAETSPPAKPLAWWKKLLIAVFGTYLATKLFGILLPDLGTADNSPQPGGSGGAESAAYSSGYSHAEETAAYTDEYPDDTWDYPREDTYEDDCIHKNEEPVDDPLYDDEDDWNDGYDDDYFS